MEEIVRDNGDHEEVWRSRAEETRYHSSSKGLKARTGSKKSLLGDWMKKCSNILNLEGRGKNSACLDLCPWPNTLS